MLITMQSRFPEVRHGALRRRWGEWEKPHIHKWRSATADDAEAERLIEVKTTGLGKFFPIYITATEVRCSEDVGEQFHLYRVFDFNDSPRLYVLAGSLRKTCRLEASQYLAAFDTSSRPNKLLVPMARPGRLRFYDCSHSVANGADAGGRWGTTVITHVGKTRHSEHGRTMAKSQKGFWFSLSRFESWPGN